MNYWLVKSEPDVYGWDTFVADKKTYWDGVRNYAARNHLQAMRKGDVVVYYHSGDERQAVGLATVVKEAYQDPTTDETAWVCVDLKAGKKLKRPVTLAEIKADAILRNTALVRIGRLSVLPLTEQEYRQLITVSEATA
jgi:predicted RNA-binding protein with PUA-like domain